MDCDDGTLDGINLPDLIILSTISEKCYSEARNAFNRTYSQANFIIEGPFGGSINYIRKTVRIRNLYLTRSILRIFGDLIHFLEISFDNINELVGNEIIGLIQDSCTESLQQIHLKECYGNILNPLKKPLPNVYIATYSTSLSYDLKRNSTGLMFKLSELLPKLVRFHVKLANINDWEMIGDKFPHLRSLNVELPDPVSATQPNVESLFENSRNINSLIIRYSSLKLLKAASTFLNNLNILEISDFAISEYDGEKIRFNNVSHLNILSTCSDDQIPEKLLFNKVQTLTMRLGYEFTDKWIRFFRNLGSKTVEFIDIKSDTVTSKHLIAIADTQPNIKIVTISSRTEISADAIVSFIEKSPELFKLQIEMGLIDVNDRQMMEDKLQHRWDIMYDYLGRNGVIFIHFTRYGFGFFVILYYDLFCCLEKISEVFYL